MNVLGSANPIVPVGPITDIVQAYNGLVQPIANRVIGSVTADITRLAPVPGDRPSAT